MLSNLFPPHFDLIFQKCDSRSLPNRASNGIKLSEDNLGKKRSCSHNIDNFYLPTGEMEVSSINMLTNRENIEEKK